MQFVIVKKLLNFIKKKVVEAYPYEAMSKDNKEKKNGRIEEGQGYKKAEFRREHEKQTNKKTKGGVEKRGENNGFVGGWEGKGKKRWKEGGYDGFQTSIVEL
jgi:hypothetical protein